MAKLRILAFSDIHGKEDIADRFVEWVRSDSVSFDVVVAAGDVGNPQRGGSMCRILRKVSEGLQKPVYYVRGNWDVEEGCGLQGVYNLDEKGPVYFGDVVLVGHGRRAEPFSIKRQARTVVLVTHYPPFSILDKGKVINSYHHSLHAGIVEINYLIDHYRPRVHIFGHSHSFGGLDIEHNGILYVNVARLDRLLKTGEPVGNYAIIDVWGSRDARVEWRFINGAWKKCSGCGRVVHIPEKWALCRKCAHKADLKFTRVGGVPYRALLVFRDAHTGGLLNSHELKIPFYTLKDALTLEDFLDVVVTRTFKEIFSADGSKVLEIPKERVIEFYGGKRADPLTPFSEYLFSCKESMGGQKLCLLMRIFSIDKRAHVFWKIAPSGSNSFNVGCEYVLFKDGTLNPDTQLLKQLAATGFKAVSYRLEAV